MEETMNKHIRRMIGTGLAVLLFCPAGALAEDGSEGTAVSGFGFGPRVGFYKPSDADEGKFFGGLQARLRVLPFLGIEGSVDYHETNFSNNLVQVRTYPVMVSGLLYFYPNPVVSPYLLAGVGWHFQDIEIRGSSPSTERSHQFGGQVGGGLDIPLGESMILDADIRYIFLDFNDDVNTRAGTALSADSVAATLGLTFYF
jgi:opacity protein-like surface antigen